jgi:hypothetical protein
MGAFFTDSETSGLVGERAMRFGQPPYFDPACGAGDLLLAISASLGLRSSPAATMAAWSNVLMGNDLQPEFTEVARHRLTLAALQRHSSQDPAAWRRLKPRPLGTRFTHVRAGDGLQRLSTLSSFSGTVVMNPPFGTVPAPAGCTWGSGLVPRAALFVDAAVDALAPNATLVAILPDVLRSGSRLEKWRQALSKRVAITETRTLGQFDGYTDVDVFLLLATRLPPDAPESSDVTGWMSPQASHATVGARFIVRTGSVVDNRDPAKGPWRAYATARTLPKSGEIELIERRRRFRGSVVDAPFVLVRRTSRPSEAGSIRIAGLVVTAGTQIAIDNHLLIATPRDGTLAACRELARVLEATETTAWLNDRIRCRHLTVGVLADIPWTGSQGS